MRRKAGSGDAEDPAVARAVGSGAGEIVERLRRNVDQHGPNKWSALGGPLPAVFVAALPLEDSPGLVAGGGKASEDLFEVDLSIAEAAEAARALLPIHVATVDTRTSGRPEFRVLHVKRLDERPR